MSFEKGFKNEENLGKKPEIQEGVFKGTIRRWSAEKGFGFLHLADGREVFCHVSELCEHIRPPRGQAPEIGSSVNIKKINERNRGLAAEKVECDDCAAPEQWELQPVGPEIFGAREFQSRCINKPNISSSLSSISPEEIERANEPFRHAKRKEDLWEWSIVKEEFFKAFGEPSAIRVEGDDKIVLSYPYGEKIISTESAMDSKHWEVAPSGAWKKIGESLKAEFNFLSIPGAKVWREIAHLSIKPELRKEFELLPDGIQREILAEVKEKVLSPESVAEKRFEELVNSDDYKIKIAQLRDDIRLLLSPGELFIDAFSQKAQLYESLSRDERRGNFYYDGKITTYFLVAGATRKERPTGGWVYSGGKKFEVSSGESNGGPEKTAEQIRDELIIKKKQEIKDWFKWARRMEPPSPDPRLYELSPEEWLKRYRACWDKLQEAFESQS